MMKLQQLIGDRYSRFDKTVKLLLVSFLMLATTLVILQTVNQKERLYSFAENFLLHNVSTPDEENRLLAIIENSDGNVSISINADGEICSPVNCYNISFFNLYKKQIKYLSVVYFFSLFLLFILVRTRRSFNTTLSKQFEIFKTILLGEKIRDEELWSEFLALKKLIEERENLKERDFQFRSISHDLKSPLSVLHILQSMELIEDKMGAELLSEATKRLEDIVDNGIESKANAEDCNFSFYDELSKIVAIFRAQYPNVEFVVKDLSRNSSIKNIYGINKTSFYRVIENLLKNSIEALKNNSDPSISIFIYEGKNTLGVEICDNGTGFNQSILDSGPKEGLTLGKENGNGIGLVGVRKIIEEIKGEFRICNNLDNGGAKVLFEVPLLA